MSKPNPRPSITKIAYRLYLGDSKSSYKREILSEHNITAVVSLSAGRWAHWIQPWYKEIVPEGNHLFIACNDNMTQDLLPKLADICDFIKQRLDSGSGSVLVYYGRGISRSPTAMIAYLMQIEQYDLATALAFVGAKRRIKPNENFKEQSEVWGAVGGNVWAAQGVPKPERAVYLAKRQERLQEAGLTGNEPVEMTSL